MNNRHQNLSVMNKSFSLLAAAFVFELPVGSEVVQAEIVDSNGQVILSIG